MERVFFKEPEVRVPFEFSAEQRDKVRIEFDRNNGRSGSDKSRRESSASGTYFDDRIVGRGIESTDDLFNARRVGQKILTERPLRKRLCPRSLSH